jgi:hypothetical protein
MDSVAELGILDPLSALPARLAHIPMSGTLSVYDNLTSLN